MRKSRCWSRMSWRPSGSTWVMAPSLAVKAQPCVFPRAKKLTQDPRRDPIECAPACDGAVYSYQEQPFRRLAAEHQPEVPRSAFASPRPAAMVSPSMPPPLRNRYYALRHGISVANEEGIIISHPESGI